MIRAFDALSSQSATRLTWTTFFKRFSIFLPLFIAKIEIEGKSGIPDRHAWCRMGIVGAK
jgi:hypothetical protein